VVEDVHIQQFARFDDLARDGDVFGGGGGVARGVVVGDNDRRRVLLQRFPRPSIRASQLPTGNLSVASEFERSPNRELHLR